MTFRCSFMAHNIVCFAIQRPTYHKRIYCRLTTLILNLMSFILMKLFKHSHHQGILRSYLLPGSKVLEALFTSLQSGLPELDGPPFSLRILLSLETSAYPESSPDCRDVNGHQSLVFSSSFPQSYSVLISFQIISHDTPGT